MLSTTRARLLLGSAALVATASLGAGPGLAQENPAIGTMEVTASVNQACTLGTIDALDFGVITPGNDKDAQTNIVVDCFLPGSVTVELDDGLHSSGDGQLRVKNGGDIFIRYNLYTDSARGNRWLDPEIIDVTSGDNEIAVYGTIIGSSSQGVTEGDYTDTVTVTLSF